MTGKPQAACGAAIRDGDGRLLLIKRLRPPEAGAWGLPGGKIDFGERAADTGRREIREELGLEIELLHIACIAETIDIPSGCHWVSPVFEARILSGEPTNLEPDKHDGWGWYALDSLPDLLTTPVRAYLSAFND